MYPSKNPRVVENQIRGYSDIASYCTAMNNLEKIIERLRNLQRFDIDTVEHPHLGKIIERDYCEEGSFVDYDEIGEVILMIKEMM